MVAGRTRSTAAPQFQTFSRCRATCQPQCLQANIHGEFCFWLAEQALSHQSSRLILVAPESSALHQQSLWSLREFQTSEGCGGAFRGATFLCQLSDRKIPQPFGVLTDLHVLHESLFAGWPSFDHTAKLSSYSGPLPVFCQCECQHVASANPVQEMGEKFWEHCLSAWLSEDFEVNFNIIFFNISGTPRDLNMYTVTSGTVGSSRCCALGWPTHNTSFGILSCVLLVLTVTVIVCDLLLVAAPCNNTLGTDLTIVSSCSSELVSSSKGLLC